MENGVALEEDAIVDVVILCVDCRDIDVLLLVVCGEACRLIIEL
jgi:hypothetical protein